MKNSLVVKFFIWIISPYDTDIRSYGLVIIGLIIIFGLLILKKLDDLKHK